MRRKAAERGQDADVYPNYVPNLALNQPAPKVNKSTLTDEEFLVSLREWYERALARNLPASTSQFRREDIYKDDQGADYTAFGRQELPSSLGGGNIVNHPSDIESAA